MTATKHPVAGGALLGLSLLVFSSAAQARTIRVPAEVPTIQEGLNLAAPGDTVLVAPGTYYENLVWPHTPSIALLAEPVPAPTVIDGRGDMVLAPVIRIAGLLVPIDSTTVVEGFIIRHGRAENGGGIYCESASPTIRANQLESNRATSGGGGICCVSSSALILANTFREDSAGAGGAIACLQGVQPRLEGNGIANCWATLGGGVYCDEGGEIIGNSVTYCQADRGGGMHLGAWSPPRGSDPRSSTALVEGNIIEHNVSGGGGGIYSMTSVPTIRFNKIRYNDVGGGLGGGLWIEGGAPLVERNEIAYNVTDYEAAGVYCCEDSSQILYNDISHNYTTVPGALGGGVFT